MKTNIFKITTLILIVAESFYSCNRHDDEEPVFVTGQITMNTLPGEIKFYIYGTGNVTVRWGDGPEEIEIYESDQPFGLYYDIHALNGFVTIEGENMKRLFCNDNQLTSLDIKSFELTALTCYNNQLSSLDVSRNTALTYLICWDNQLSNLDVSKNDALTYLDCSGNQLSSLDVSNKPALTYLECAGNQLSYLDVSNSTVLQYLSCTGNQLSNLDVSENRVLMQLYCDNNQLTSLDLGLNYAFTDVDCSFNNLSTEALNNLFTSLSDWNYNATITIHNNPGSDDCDTSIATEKGWNVN